MFPSLQGPGGGAGGKLPRGLGASREISKTSTEVEFEDTILALLDSR